MVAQVAAILALILGDDHLPGVFVLGQALLWVVMAAALISAADYFRRFNLFAGPRPVDIALERERRTERKIV
jgi:hypothetical protein